jgi:PAS domain S-box-containing protein
MELTRHTDARMNLRRLVLVLGAAAAVVVLAATAAIVWVAREDAFKRTETRLGDLSIVLAEQIARSLGQIDSILLGVADDLARRAADPRNFSEALLHEALAARARVPQVQSIAVLDLQGRGIASSHAFPIAPTDVSDRDFFRAHRERGARGLQLEALATARITGLPSVTLSRPVVGPKGELRAVVAAYLDTAYLTGLYESLSLGPDAGVGLYRADGTLVFGAAADGGAAALPPSLRAPAPASVRVARLAAPAGGRIAAASALRDIPLVVAVSTRTDHALQAWRREALFASALGTLAAAFLMALAIATHRRLESVSRHRADMLESAGRLDAIVQSAMDALVTVTENQRIVVFNAAAEKMFGCSAAEALGGPLERFIPDRFRGAHRDYVERFARTGETARRMGHQTALRALRADGAEFPIEASISQASARGERLLTVIVRDITERVRAEAELARSQEQMRELAVAMLEVREAERTRIARELHDELGQTLTGLKMDVELLARTVPAERADLLERVQAMRELIDATVATTRRISTDLRPLVLDDLGLGAAAEWLAQNVAQRAGLECELEFDPAFAHLGEPHASALFRVMQESLTNVVRHADARRVAVRLERVDGAAVLSVSDDGVGMDAAARGKPRSFGLRGISERVLLLGGAVSITSEPGAGTTVRARIPLARAQAREAA